MTKLKPGPTCRIVNTGDGRMYYHFDNLLELINGFVSDEYMFKCCAIPPSKVLFHGVTITEWRCLVQGKLVQNEHQITCKGHDYAIRRDFDWLSVDQVLEMIARNIRAGH